MSLSKSLAGVASGILKKFGVESVFTHYAEAGFNEGTGESTFTETTFESYGIKSTYSKNEIDGTNIQYGDIKLILEEPEGVPQIGDKCVINGSGAYRVMSVDPVSPAEENIIYNVQLRV